MKLTRPEEKQRAFTLTELVVVILTIGLLFGLTVPVLFQFIRKSQRITCVSNLKSIGLGSRIWRTDHGELFPTQAVANAVGSTAKSAASTGKRVFEYFQPLSNELSTPKILHCPSDVRGEAANFFTLRNRNISYFFGLDADETGPSFLLAGDRNLTTNGVPAGPGIVEITTNMTVGWTKELHRFRGNVTLGDGSVQQFSHAQRPNFISTSGPAANRLIIP